MTPERKVGIVVSLAILVALASVFLIGKVRLGVSGYSIKVQYKFLNDLKVDAPVKYAAGLIVGHVQQIYMDGDLVTAVLWIDRRYKIRNDCQFWIFTTGMLGEMYVEIDASPSGTAEYIAGGSVIRGIDPTSTDATLIRLGKMVDALAPIFAREDVGASVHSMVADMKRAAAAIAGVVDKHSGRLDEALGSLEQFSRNLSKMSKDTEAIMAQLKVLADPNSTESVHVTLRRLNSAMASLEDTSKVAQSIAKKIDTGKGTLATLINDEKMANDLRALVKKLKDEPITVRTKIF